MPFLEKCCERDGNILENIYIRQTYLCYNLRPQGPHTRLTRNKRSLFHHGIYAGRTTARVSLNLLSLNPATSPRICIRRISLVDSSITTRISLGRETSVLDFAKPAHATPARKKVRKTELSFSEHKSRPLARRSISCLETDRSSERLQKTSPLYSRNHPYSRNPASY